MNKLSTPTLAIAACLLWSTAFVCIKLGLEYIDNPLQFGGMRFMISGLMLLPFCGNLKKLVGDVRKNLFKVAQVAFFQIFLLYALFYIAIDIVPGALTAILIGSSPLFAAVIAHFAMKDDKLKSGKLLSILIGIIGVILISFDPSASIGGKVFGGMILLVLTCISSAVGNVLVSKNKTSIAPIPLNCVQLIMGGAAMLVLSPVYGELAIPYGETNFWLLLLWLSFLSAAAFSIWFKLLSRPSVKVSDLNVWKFVIPVCGAILSWLILPKEHPSVVAVVGMLVIALSLIMLARANRKVISANSNIE